MSIRSRSRLQSYLSRGFTRGGLTRHLAARLCVGVLIRPQSVGEVALGDRDTTRTESLSTRTVAHGCAWRRRSIRIWESRVSRASSLLPRSLLRLIRPGLSHSHHCLCATTAIPSRSRSHRRRCQDPTVNASGHPLWHREYAAARYFLVQLSEQ